MFWLRTRSAMPVVGMPLPIQPGLPLPSPLGSLKMFWSNRVSLSCFST
jgi:hypothetical protein